MSNNWRHCRPVTKSPVAAQSSLSLKLGFAGDVMEYTLTVQRAKPWGLIWPPNYTGTSGTTGGTTGGTTNGTTGGATDDLDL